MQIWHAKALQQPPHLFLLRTPPLPCPSPSTQRAKARDLPSGKAMREARLFLRPRSNIPPASLPIFVVSFAGCARQLFPFPIMDILRRSLDYALLGSFKRKANRHQIKYKKELLIVFHRKLIAAMKQLYSPTTSPIDFSRPAQYLGSVNLR